MAPNRPGKIKKEKKEKKPSPGVDWFDTGVNAGLLMLDTIQNAATMAGVPYVKQAAAITCKIVEAAQNVQLNKADFRRLANDANNIIAAIYYSYQISANQKEWPPSELRVVISELVITLESIRAFIEEQIERNKAIRFISAFADKDKIKEYRERLQAAISKFEISSHLNLNETISMLAKQQAEINAKLSVTPSLRRTHSEASIILAQIHKVDAAADEEKRIKEKLKREEQELIEGRKAVQKLQAEQDAKEQAFNSGKIASDLARLQIEKERLGKKNLELEAMLEARKYSLEVNKHKRRSEDVTIRVESEEVDSVDDDIMMAAAKRYKHKEKKLFSETGQRPRKYSSRRRARMESEEEEESEDQGSEEGDGSAIDVSSESQYESTDEEERRRRENKSRSRRNTQKTRPASSSPRPPHSYQSPQSNGINPNLTSQFAQMGLNPATGQPYPSPYPSPPLYPNTPPLFSPHGYQNPPWNPYSPPLPTGVPYGNGYVSQAPGSVFMMSNAGNFTNNNISNIGNTNNTTNMQPEPPHHSRRKSRS